MSTTPGYGPRIVWMNPDIEADFLHLVSESDPSVVVGWIDEAGIPQGSLSFALQPPAPSSLGGVKSHAAQANQFLTAVGTDGSISAAQPAFTDLSGAASVAQMAALLDVNNAWTGDETHSGIESFKNINTIRFADQFAGADAGAKIAAAVADLPSTGGVVDARGITGTVAISSTIVLDRPVALYLGATNYVASCSPAIRDVTGFSSIHGIGDLGTGLLTQLTFSTIGIEFAPAPDPVTSAGGGVHGLCLVGPGGGFTASTSVKLIDGNGLRFSDILITATFVGFEINDFAHYCEFNTFERISMRSSGGGDLRWAFRFTNNHNGDISSNTWKDIFVDGTGTAGSASRFFYFDGAYPEIMENNIATNIIISPSADDQTFLGTGDRAALSMQRCHFEVYRQTDNPPDTSLRRFVLNVPGDSVAWSGFIDAPAGDILAGGTSVVPVALDLDGFRRVKAGTGFQIAGAATSGHVLRGNGTDFVDAALAAADLSNGVTGSGAVVLAANPTFTASIKIPEPAGSDGNYSLDVSPTSVSIANNATFQPFGASSDFAGMLIITDSGFSGDTAVFINGGGPNVTKISESSATAFSTTLDNAGTINVYLSSGAITIQNKLGSDTTVKIISFRTRAGN